MATRNKRQRKPATVTLSAATVEEIAHTLNAWQIALKDNDVAISPREEGAFWAFIRALPEEIQRSVIN